MEKSLKWTDNELLDILKKGVERYKKENGRIPYRRDWDILYKFPCSRTYWKRFGSWNNAIKLIGENPIVGNDNEIKLSNEELAQLLRKWGDAHGNVPPLKRDFQQDEECPCVSVYIKRFGTWNNALVAAGYKRKKKGEWKFRGGRYKDQYGYIWLWMPSYTDENGIRHRGHNKAEHRYKMEMKLGRRLRKEETVHHKNGIRSDNRIGNLELWSSSHGRGQRVCDLIRWAIRFLKIYGYTAEKACPTPKKEK